MKSILLLSIIFFSSQAAALQPQFSISEYNATLKMNFCQYGKISDTMICKPNDWERVYRSQVSGLENRFDIWLRISDTTMGISLRPTTKTSSSWMENFYAAMIPAKGSMIINDSTTFNYCFAEKSDAAVHIGWTYGLGAMEQDLIKQIMRYYAEGVHNFLIFGHSQGGALSYLAHAHFYYLQQKGQLPKDIIFKMYASAGPKVGNIHFAYDFESNNSLGWAFNVVNPEDWIPLMPFSSQTTDDMTSTSPFKHVKTGLKTQKLTQRVALGTVYRGIDRKTRKARRALKKNLGIRVGKQVQKSRKQYQQPDFHHSQNYCRAGNHIILKTFDAYYSMYPKDSDDPFKHHMLAPYLMLAEAWEEGNP